MGAPAPTAGPAAACAAVGAVHPAGAAAGVAGAAGPPAAGPLGAGQAGCPAAGAAGAAGALSDAAGVASVERVASMGASSGRPVGSWGVSFMTGPSCLGWPDEGHGEITPGDPMSTP
ncbi:hypothetical protein FGQ65_12510 [Clavibacter nebraskensis]|nr:hypothetical protein FGQ65_12510 [Clavibacter nebraskensis]